MLKRIVAMTLCLVCLLLCFAGCGKSELDKGAYIRMYLGEPVYDLDPLKAFDNQSTLQIVSLLFEGLFEADENGKAKKALVDEYEYVVDEERGTYTLVLTLKESFWSDGVPVTATDAQFAFVRLFKSSHPAKAGLYCIKNARAIAEGNKSVDTLGVVPKGQDLEIEFEYDVNVDAFLTELCSPALYPLRSDKVEGNVNWAKSTENFVCNGPFTVRTMNFNTKEKDGFVLERNSYFYRDRLKDKDDKTITPFRIVLDFSTPGADQLATLNSGNEGSLQFLGYIPLASRAGLSADLVKKMDVTNAASTHTLYLNENAVIGGKTLFADKNVRKALSLALDRTEIANALVYAEAATGLVPTTLLNRADKKATFRDKAEAYLSTSKNVEAAKDLLKEAGITASDYSFSITVNALDEEHLKIAELTKAAWAALGFKVSLQKLGVQEIVTLTVTENGDDEPQVETTKTGMYESLYQDALYSGNFEVIALDLVATSPSAFSYLAPFATAFSGNLTNVDYTQNPTFALSTHITGYNSEAYNAKIEAAYAEKNEKQRAVLLHEAEGILMDEMPAIPVVFNQTTALCAKGVSRVKNSFFALKFNKTKLKNYWEIAIRDGFVEEE